MAGIHARDLGLGFATLGLSAQPAPATRAPSHAQLGAPAEAGHASAPGAAGPP